MYKNSEPFSHYYDNISKNADDVCSNETKKKSFKSIPKSVISRWMKEMVHREIILQKKMEDFIKKKKNFIQEKEKFDKEKVDLTFYFA